MEDVTDAAFRRLIARYGKPDVMFCEFTSADGIAHLYERTQSTTSAEFTAHPLAKKLLFHESERPVVAQLFSAIPERMETATRVVKELGFDGLDINMGCPDRSVEKSGCGADMIKHPERARAIIRAARRGSGCSCASQTCTSKSCFPISVKTRIGYSKDEIGAWLPQLFSEQLAALTVHLRTRNEMSGVPAHWEAMPRIVALRNSLSPATRIVGNGDARDVSDARAKVTASGCDGVMLGRAIYGNPWLYTPSLTIASVEGYVPDQTKKITALIEHIRLFDELLGSTKNFAVMKKHFKAYISGWDGAKGLRERLMNTVSASECMRILAEMTHLR